MWKRIAAFLMLAPVVLTACQKESFGEERDYKTLGTAAHNLLSAAEYSGLRVEISYMPGYAPDGAALQNLEIFLNTYLHKPGGITVSARPIASANKPEVTLDDVVQLERRYRAVFTGTQTIAVHILVVDAGYSAADILALSYWNTSICLFGATIAGSSGGTGQAGRSKMYSTLLAHEFGHLLGLVDQGSPMQSPHRDAGSSAHCTNPQCLMYYAVETGDGLSPNAAIPSLDAACLNDLKANGGK
jgi:hypothetical protein